jgi:flagellar export protein FliJ
VTVPPRTVRALRDARRLLRDAAAAEWNDATTTSQRYAEAASAADDEADETLDRAVDALAQARTVHDLHRVAETVAQSRAEADEAARVARAAEAQAAAARERLVTRERQLRTVDRLLDRMHAERARGDAKSDQSLADDRAGRPRES